MARDNPVQFAVVREDPEIEATLVRRTRSRNALLIASGGCTALSLRALFPDLGLTLVDPNRAQLDLVQRKAQMLEAGASRQLFNVDDDSPDGVNACGNFESLFRGFRDFVREFVAPAPELENLLTAPDGWRAIPERLFAQRYWKAAFDLFFSDALLNTMFGAAATRHAERGSYPGYFRGVFERGMTRPDASENYFLHHVFLGRYRDRPTSLPPYLVLPARPSRFEMIVGGIDVVEDFGRYDLIALSNIFDWMDSAEVAKLARRLSREMHAGATVVFRQLNNPSDLASLFGPVLTFDAKTAAQLLAADRSLFYSVLRIGTKGESS